MQAVISILFLLALGVIVRSMFSRNTPKRLSTDRAWLNRLRDANKDFADTWTR